MELKDTAEQRTDPIVLGGRSFRVVDFNKRTVRADHYMAKLIRQTGADKVTPMEGEDDTVYLIRMQTLLIDSGKVPELIAGLLLPEGMEEKQWTYSVAKATAEHIAACNTPDDRELVNQLAMDIVFGFFKQGLAWLARSLSSFRERGLLDEDSVTSPPVNLKPTSGTGHPSSVQ